MAFAVPRRGHLSTAPGRAGEPDHSTRWQSERRLRRAGRSWRVHPLTSGHDPVNGLDRVCVAAIAQPALATPLSFECAVLHRLVPEHFGRMWKV
jgi:hypothetical protein